MRFVLRYRGRLHSNGSTRDKAELRRALSPQLEVLWKLGALKEHNELLAPSPSGEHYSAVRSRDGATYVPLVSAQLKGLADLDILLLRPGTPGGLITQGGDIDNRLKTLFDALSMPQNDNQVLPEDRDLPRVYCVVENDALISSVSVRTEQLLDPGVSDKDVELIMTVTTRVTRRVPGNDFLA